MLPRLFGRRKQTIEAKACKSCAAKTGTAMSEPELYTAGKPISSIDVRISYRIIQLFSEGLYSSPNKANEE